MRGAHTCYLGLNSCPCQVSLLQLWYHSIQPLDMLPVKRQKRKDIHKIIEKSSEGINDQSSSDRKLKGKYTNPLYEEHSSNNPALFRTSVKVHTVLRERSYEGKPKYKVRKYLVNTSQSLHTGKPSAGYHKKIMLCMNKANKNYHSTRNTKHMEQMHEFKEIQYLKLPDKTRQSTC